MSRPRSSLTALFAVVATVAMLLGAAGGGVAGCDSTGTTDTVQPVTGVTVRADSLFAGRGCGTAPTQLFKYAVLVYVSANRKAEEYVAGNVYDCFTDGTFVELPSIVPSIYTMEIFAYSRQAYLAAGGDALSATVGRMNKSYATLAADAGGPAEREAIAADLELLRSTRATYSTTCTAEQIGLVQTLAVCQPLQLGSTGTGGDAGASTSVVLSLAKFTKADGTALTCDNQYVTVRSSYGVGAVETPATETRCSTLGDAGLESVSITISPAQAPASYVFSVTLLRADGTTLGATTCGAETSPGLTITAICQPVP